MAGLKMLIAMLSINVTQNMTDLIKLIRKRYHLLDEI